MRSQPILGQARRQRGVVLAVALIMLMMLSLLSVSALQVTGLEARMAGNMSDRALAFQAAEAALREGERQLDVPDADLPIFNRTNGFYPAPKEGEIPVWASYDGVSQIVTSATFWTANGRPYGGGADGAAVAGVSAPPRYIVEELPYAPGVGDSFEANLPKDQQPSYYRITARASGGAQTTVVVLQSTYRRP